MSTNAVALRRPPRKERCNAAGAGRKTQYPTGAATVPTDFRSIRARTTADDWFLAHAFGDRADAELCALLGCHASELPVIGLCRRPRDARERELIEVRFGLRVGSVAAVCGVG